MTNSGSSSTPTTPAFGNIPLPTFDGNDGSGPSTRSPQPTRSVSSPKSPTPARSSGGGYGVRPDNPGFSPIQPPFTPTKPGVAGQSGRGYGVDSGAPGLPTPITSPGKPGVAGQTGGGYGDIGTTRNPIPTQIYTLKVNAPVIEEGSPLVAIVSAPSGQSLVPGTTLFWRVTGSEITPADFSTKSLSGSDLVGQDGTLQLNLPVAVDELAEADEILTLEVKDSASVPVSVDVTIKNVVPVDPNKEWRTYGLQVDEYVLGAAKNDSLSPNSKNAGKSLAFWGMSGRDTIIAGKSNDILNGGPGQDVLSGGLGKDTFVFSDRLPTDTDLIRDFSVKDDVIGISAELISANLTDFVSIVSFNQIKNKNSAEKFFKSKESDHYVLIDKIENIRKVASSTWSKKVQIALDTSRNAVLFDLDGDWKKGSVTLCKLDGQFSSKAWAPKHFAFGIETAPPAP